MEGGVVAKDERGEDFGADAACRVVECDGGDGDVEGCVLGVERGGAGGGGGGGGGEW